MFVLFVLLKTFERVHTCLLSETLHTIVERLVIKTVRKIIFRIFLTRLCSLSLQGAPFGGG